MTPKVLIVEDNEMNRDMLTRRLTKKGFLVSTAEDGQEAVDCIDGISPDIVLMDMSLPKMDGLEATRRIRSSALKRNVPIIVLTANATTIDRDNALAAGCDDFETKPVNLPQLLEKMNSFLHRVG
ncbi:MAG TPA: two-component system response regulator [Microbacterium sp.]|nr:two-component system response regulator [Microbacterium sp.]|tara:strand:- start:1600 stop:1974 length:375 start_codon:yes stop_codon:yes gene_type:complete